MRDIEALRDSLHQNPTVRDCQVRWLIRRDMPEVLDVDYRAHELAWGDEDFLSCLRRRNCIGMVVERERKIVGLMVYELHKTRLDVLRFAVDPEWQRSGIGSLMMLRLIDKLSQQRRDQIVFRVPEHLLAMQLFLRRCGFLCVAVEPDGEDRDIYVMSYLLNKEAACAN